MCPSLSVKDRKDKTNKHVAVLPWLAIGTSNCLISDPFKRDQGCNSPGTYCPQWRWAPHNSVQFMLNALRLMVPSIQMVEEEANRITKLSACWTDDDGFKKTHTFKFGYEYNDEALAYHQGTWSEEHNCYIYITARGNVHVCSAEQADTYRRSRDEREVKYQQAHTRHYGTADVEPVVVDATVVS